MRKVFFILILILFIIEMVFTETSKSDLLIFFEEWKTISPNSSSLIKYVKVKDLLTPNTVLFDNIDDTFTEGIYEYTIRDSDLAVLIDIDKDGIDEAFTLLIRGSGRFPSFYGFKKDRKSGKFKRIISEERNIEPADLGGQLYFIESQRDFNSGRWPSYIILKMNHQMTFEVVANISKIYTYTLNSDVGRYVSSEQLNQIASQDYSFLGIHEKQPTDFEITKKSHIIRAHIRWTSVGYYATTVDLDIRDTDGSIKLFKNLWGFSIAEVDGIYYLCTLLMDDVNRVSVIQDFRINIYRMSDWMIVASQFVTASKINVVY